MDVERRRSRYTDLLLDRVEETRFPSNEYMGRIEASLATPEQAERYVDILTERVEDAQYPSLQLLDRLRRVLDQVAASPLAGHDEDDRGDAKG